MITTKMQGMDIWVRYTDREGRVHTVQHRVWDVGLFMTKREEEAGKSGGKVEQVLKP